METGAENARTSRARRIRRGGSDRATLYRRREHQRRRLRRRDGEGTDSSPAGDELGGLQPVVRRLPRCPHAQPGQLVSALLRARVLREWVPATLRRPGGRGGGRARKRGAG